MLVLQRKKNQSIMIGSDIELSVLEVGSDWVKIAISAPKDISILRKELAEAAQAKAEEAQAKAEAAQAAAEAAQAEADANQKIAESLTPELVEKIKFDAWDGKLPTVQSDGSAIIDLR